MREDILKKINEARANGEILYSFSRLESFNDCLYAYNITYNQHNRGLDNIYALLGTSIHDGLEHYFNCGENELQERFDKGYENALKDGYNFPNDKIKENYLYCINHYIKNFKSDGLNSLQEFPFMIELNGIKIIGFIDRITKDPNSSDNTLRIIDFKTSTNYSKKEKQIKGRQLVLYAYAVEQLTGKKVTSVCWNMLKYINVKYKKKTRKTKKIFLRNEYVLFWKDEILQSLQDKGYEFEDAIDIFMEHLQKNEMPNEVLEDFEFGDAYVEYEYNDETKQELLDYIEKTVKKINKTKEWKAKNISNGDFKCLNLCNHRETCPALKSYIQKLPETMVEETGINFDELF